ncbi:MAG: Flp pilus assembly complex ATPase component TadA [Candidatus Aureabacteria bacterium]|nr:Flp pilus assembly complex ATPase component TadA [Candidatus Auribacterota bacterium]
MIGKALVEKGVINKNQLDEALRLQVKDKNVLGSILVKLGYCFEEDVARSIAEIYELPYIDLVESDIDSGTIRHIPENLAFRHSIVPVKIEGNTLSIACSKPLNAQVTANLRRLLNKQIASFIASDSAINTLLKRNYAGSIAFSGKILAEDDIDQSIIDVLNEYISDALKQRSSDIHIEPQKDRLRIRFRIDGVLKEINTLSKKLSLPLISRIKILSGLDIAEKRAPQDGSFIFEDVDGSTDIRVSVLPNIHGEKAVLRLLPSKKRVLTLEGLGMEKDCLKVFKMLIKRPHGIILITGPTGSGKTTTLYAALSMIRSARVNITTIEDPVEYQIEGITQTQVDHANKITFAKALKSILRQDPDIIMVGEIRDKETADIALRSALTGHLVFSTLHTNDSSSALTRLVDMGCEPFLVSSTVCAILAQRLVRVNCEFCKKPFNPPGGEFNKDINWVREGCKHCQKTGYKGRTGIFELLKIDAPIQTEIVKNSSAERIKEVAVSHGMKTLQEDGFLRAKKGVTSPEEVMRTTALD